MSNDLRPIRVTATNAGPDSKGMVSIFGWDLEGLVAFYIVLGGVIGLLLVFSLVGRPMTTRIGLGLLPVVGSAAWVKIFIHGRPPSFQSDIFEKWIRGPHFRLRPQRWCRRQPPRERLLRELEEKARRHA